MDKTDKAYPTSSESGKERYLMGVLLNHHKYRVERSRVRRKRQCGDRKARDSLCKEGPDSSEVRNRFRQREHQMQRSCGRSELGVFMWLDR